MPAVGFAGLLLVALSVAVVALPNGDSGSGGRRRWRQRRLLGRRRRGRVRGSGGAAGRPSRRRRPRRTRPPTPCSPSARPPCRPAGLRARPQRPQDRALGGARAGRARRPDGAAGRAGDRGHNRYGGFVLSSSLSTGEDDAGGDFDLRIPADPPAPRAARPRRARHGALPEPVRPRRHAAARDRPGPAAPRHAPSAPACCAGSSWPTPTRRPRACGAGSTWWRSRSAACARSCAPCGSAPTTRP